MPGTSNAAKSAVIAPLIAALRERTLTQWVESEYFSLSEGLKPPDGVWIRRYPPVPLDADGVNDQAVFPHAVWFLDERGLRRENVWKWRRFVTVHWEQPWCKRSAGEPSGNGGRPYRIGLAAFAPYVDGSGFYMETQWAGLYGHGWRVLINANGAMGRSGIWIS